MGHADQPLWRRAATHTLHTALLLKAHIEERELVTLARIEALVECMGGPEKRPNPGAFEIERTDGTAAAT